MSFLNWLGSKLSTPTPIEDTAIPPQLEEIAAAQPETVAATLQMTLRQMQSLHVLLVAKLITFAYAHGYELTWGETIRTQAEANANAASGAGISHSLHLIGLAIDLMLFKDGVYLTRSEDYEPLGTFWVSLHPLARWGGDFKPPAPVDGNHFSLEWEGRK